MKRLVCIILTALLLCSLVACDFFSDSPEESGSSIPIYSGECATLDELESSAVDGSISESPTLSEDDILDSVLSSIERSFDNDNYGTYTTYNFINDEDGFFFHFAFSNNQNQLILFMKTLDGGKTWFPQAIEKMPSTHWKERIICAKMIDDSVGIISGAFYADNESVSRRIFMTTNGGITWNNVKIPYMGIDTGNSEVYDIKYEDDKYILCFRMLETATEHHYVYFDYTSTDLVNWELVSEESSTSENDNIDTNEYSFIPKEKKNIWHDSLISVLSQAGIYDQELNVTGSFAAGLMDLDFDNIPEVILAYHGGSMGNVPLEIYDLNTGEKFDFYSFSHYDGSDNVYLSVAQKGEEYVIIAKGSIRITGADYKHSVGTVKADKNSETDYIKISPLFSIENEGDEITYTYMGQTVDKAEFDNLYQQFSNDYVIIEETQLQLIKWENFGKLEWKDFGDKEGIDPESKQKLVEQMADALINSSQEFIKYDIFDNSDSAQESENNESDIDESTENSNTDTEPEIKTELSEKYPGVPKDFDYILDAYVEIANLTRYKGCTTREKINDEDYPKVSKEHIDVIFNSLIDGWRNGIYGYFAGYAIKDVNGDGIPELFLTDVEYTIYAMFTLVNGEIDSHYFYKNDNTVALDVNGNFYMNDKGKGECEWYEILQLGTSGEFYGTTFGHYDMTGFGDDDIYNYYYTTSANSSSENKINDEEYNNLVASYNENLKNLDSDGCGKPNHVTHAAGLEFYQVITEDLRK